MKVLSRAASSALVIGALGSLALMLSFARTTPPLLIFLYSGWVMLPFVALAVGRRRIEGRATLAVRTMDTAALVITVAALVIYVIALVLPNAPRPAAVFLLCPLASNVVTGVAYAVAVAQARAAHSSTSTD